MNYQQNVLILNYMLHVSSYVCVERIVFNHYKTKTINFALNNIITIGKTLILK